VCRVTDICSKPRIWNYEAAAISLETRSTGEITRPREDRNPTPFRLTGSQRHFYTPTLDFADLRYVEDSGY